MARKGKASPGREVTRRRLARWQRERRWRRMLISLAALTIVVILAVVGYGYYDTNIAPGRALLSTVNGTMRTVRFTGADYLHMLKVLGTSDQTSIDYPLLMLEQYELMSQGAEELGIEISDEEVTEKIKGVLFPDDGEVGEEEFEQAYQQAIADSGLSEEDFRWFFDYQLLQEKLDELLREQVPQETLQLHLQGILVDTLQKGEEVRLRLNEGEDFAALARELSLDEASKESGGDLGWLPRGIKGQDFDEVAFNLELGEVSEPFFTAEGYYWVIRVLEREENRTLDEGVREQLQDGAFGNWLAAEREGKVERKVSDEELERIYHWAMRQAS